MLKKYPNGELFDKFLELSDLSSVFKILSKMEYVILRKIIYIADANVDSEGKVYLEDLRADMNIPMAKVSEIVRTMSDEGWLMWNLDQVSKKTYVQLTNNGREKFGLQAEGLKKISERFSAELSEEEQKCFYSVLGKFGDILNQERNSAEAYFELLLGRMKNVNMNFIGLLKPKSSVTYINEDCSVEQVVSVLKDSGYTTIPVIDMDGRYIGTVSEGDCLWYINDYGVDALGQATAKNIVNKKRNPAVHDVVNNKMLVDNILSQNFLCMVDDRDCFIGIITRKDIIQYLKQKVEK